ARAEGIVEARAFVADRRSESVVSRLHRIVGGTLRSRAGGGKYDTDHERRGHAAHPPRLHATPCYTTPRDLQSHPSRSPAMGYFPLISVCGARPTCGAWTICGAFKRASDPLTQYSTRFRNGEKTPQSEPQFCRGASIYVNRL